MCKLCGTELETPTHLCKDCNFTKQVWFILKQWLGLSLIDTVPMAGSLHSYWRKCQSRFDKDQRRAFNGIIIYFWWNVWKERNRRTFQNKTMRPGQVALLCKEDLEQYHLATRANVGLHKFSCQFLLFVRGSWASSHVVVLSGLVFLVVCPLPSWAPSWVVGHRVEVVGTSVSSCCWFCGCPL
jgi:hypothetical protein